jgi:hypothetical protein
MRHATLRLCKGTNVALKCRIPFTTNVRHGYDTTTPDKGPPGRTPRLLDSAGVVLPITAPGTQKENLK